MIAFIVRFVGDEIDFPEASNSIDHGVTVILETSRVLNDDEIDVNEIIQSMV